MVLARTEPTIASAWDLGFIGLLIFSFAIITLRLPIADLGITMAIIGVFFQKEKFRIPSFVWLLLLYVVWCLLASIFSDYWNLATESLIDRLKMVAMVLTIINVVRTPRQFWIFLLFIIFCFMIYPIRGALMNYIGGYTVFGRALWNSTYANPNDLAALAMLGLGVMLSIALAPSQQRYIRWAVSISAVATVTVIFLTQSRGAIVGLVVGFGAVAFKALTKNSRRVLLAILTIAVLAVSIPESAWERYAGMSKLTNTQTISDADPEGSADQRWRIAKTAWRIWLDHPLLGTGLNSYVTVNTIYAPDIGARDTHNTYLNLAAELGTPGLLIWLSCVASVFSVARHHLRSTSLQPGAMFDLRWIQRALIGFMVAGVFGSYSRLNLFYFALALLWLSVDLSGNLSSSPSDPSRLKSRSLGRQQPAPSKLVEQRFPKQRR